VTRVCCIYNYPVPSLGAEHAALAERFVKSYQQYPPLFEHTMLVVSNGGPPAGKAIAQFSWIKDTRFLQRDNHGMDIGAYQLAATYGSFDMMVFFGGSSYIRGMGWLKRMVSAFETVGQNDLFGCTGNQGELYAKVWPHIRTTALWCSPKLINEHPFRVTRNDQRYPFEHGPVGLTSWVLSSGRKAWVVGWDDIKGVHECNSMREGFHQGSQANVMVGDRLCAPPYHICP